MRTLRQDVHVSTSWLDYMSKGRKKWANLYGSLWLPIWLWSNGQIKNLTFNSYHHYRKSWKIFQWREQATLAGFPFILTYQQIKENFPNGTHKKEKKNISPIKPSKNFNDPKNPWEALLCRNPEGCTKHQFNLATFLQHTLARAWWSATPTEEQVKHKVARYMALVNEKIAAQLTDKLGSFRKTWSQWVEYYLPNGLEYPLWTL